MSACTVYIPSILKLQRQDFFVVKFFFFFFFFFYLVDRWLCVGGKITMVVFLRINSLLNAIDQMNQDYVPPPHNFMIGIIEHNYTDEEE